MTDYNKLVRNKIPEIIVEKGSEPHTRKLTKTERAVELLNKLLEEALELQETPCLDERADIAQVLREIDDVYGFTDGEIESARAQKAIERGDFSEGIFLISVDDSSKG